MGQAAVVGSNAGLIGHAVWASHVDWRGDAWKDAVHWQARLLATVLQTLSITEGGWGYPGAQAGQGSAGEKETQVVANHIRPRPNPRSRIWRGGAGWAVDLPYAVCTYTPARSSQRPHRTLRVCV